MTFLAENEALRDELRGHRRAPIRAWDDHRAHEIEQLRYRLEQQQRETAHFKVIAQQMERGEQLAHEDSKRCLARALDADEALAKALESTGGVVPEFQYQGSFTICVLVDPVSERVFTGAACCNVSDTFNQEIGKAISLGRAMASRAEYFANAAYAR